MKYYITTPLYYVNDEPHIGHAYTNIAADTVARYKRLKGFDLFFLTGTDEHGQKIEREAVKRGIAPQDLADQMVERFKELWKRLSISYTDFIRTTQQRHIEAAKELFKRIYERGDIYKGRYEGPYCVPCESYVKEKICPSCKRECEIVSEETYFFKLSSYKERLISMVEKGELSIEPGNRRIEMQNIIEDGMSDVSITRSTFSWGIPVPIEGAKDIIYVWFEALINYISGIGYPKDKEVFERYWPADLHLVGKDIMRFHTILWPAMLISADISPPKRVFGHGWWTVDGEKMSKSKGNVVNPFEMTDEVGTDGLRYFLLREVPFGSDGDFSKKALVHRLNGDLANDLGNLVFRVIKMAERYLKNRVPDRADGEGLREIAIETAESVDKDMEDLMFHIYLEKVWRFIRECNRYVDYKKPWSLPKERRAPILYNLLESLRIISTLISPVTPNIAESIAQQLGLSPSSFSLVDLEWGGMEPGEKVFVKAPVFMRIE
jgi:methionyl-tRNA synthetase